MNKKIDKAIERLVEEVPSLANEVIDKFFQTKSAIREIELKQREKIAYILAIVLIISVLSWALLQWFGKI